MARDRLAGLRGQQGGPGSGAGGYQQSYDSYPQQSQQPSYDRYGQQPASGGYHQPSQYPSRAPASGGLPSRPAGNTGGGAYGGAYGGGAPQQQQYGQGPVSGPAGSAGSDLRDPNAFFEQINEIQSATRDLNDRIARIGDLHNRQLGAVANEEEHAQVTRELSRLTDETRRMSNGLKTAIKRLEADTAKRPPGDPDTNVRRTQVGAVKNRFMEAIQNYQRVEQESRKKHRQRMERQIKIVKPEASQAEINAAVNNENGQGDRIFEQALVNSNRFGDARAAYREVQERNVEIRKIEQTLTELAAMFNDMALLVEEQDAQVVQVEAKAADAEQNMGQAEGQLQKAVKSARAARRKRWICFIIILVILAVIGIAVGVTVKNNQKN